MNVIEINIQGSTAKLSQFVALILPLTIVVFWIFIAFQSKYIFPRGTSFYKRLGWPFFVIDFLRKCLRRKKFQDQPLRLPAEH
jgi:hypothetical protein